MRLIKNIFAGEIASVEKIETIVKEIDGKITGETLYTLGSKVIDLYHFYHYWDAVPTCGTYLNDCIDFLKIMGTDDYVDFLKRNNLI
jgi:hypothetical protein